MKPEQVDGEGLGIAALHQAPYRSDTYQLRRFNGAPAVRPGKVPRLAQPHVNSASSLQWGPGRETGERACLSNRCILASCREVFERLPAKRVSGQCSGGPPGTVSIWLSMSTRTKGELGSTGPLDSGSGRFSLAGGLPLIISDNLDPTGRLVRFSKAFE